jgi:integrase
MFRFGVGQAILEASPCDKVETPSEENERNRVLTEDEIRTIWLALASAPMEPNARRILKLMLITGQRKGEVIGMHKGEIEKSIWTLSSERTKNGREHLVPLSTTALDVLAEVEPNDAGYFFPSSLTGRPYRGQSVDHAVRYLFDPRTLPEQGSQEKRPDAERTSPCRVDGALRAARSPAHRGNPDA